MPTTILFIGLLVFFAHFLSLQFRKTSIPDMPVSITLTALLVMVYPLPIMEKYYARSGATDNFQGV